jgi:hypothetical protein
MMAIHAALVLLIISATAGCAQRTARALPDGEAVAEFDSRVKAYAALRDEVERGAAKLSETDKPEEIATAEKALAARLQAARATAKRGDIFTPAVQTRFRRLLNPELKGLRGRNTRGIIEDEAPGDFPFKVNGVYPESEPLGTVPPNILTALPPLPEDLEYRFIDNHLILRDARANLIIDYIPDAISQG